MQIRPQNPPHTPIEQLLFGPVLTAQILGLSRTVVFGLMRDGKLASILIGRRRLITRAAIEEFINKAS